MLINELKNELKFAARQPIFIIGMILFALYGLFFSAVFPSNGPDAVKQLKIVQIALLMLSLPILISILASLLFLRDENSNMSELILVTPVTFKKRWLTRCLALIIISLVAFSLLFLITMGSLSWQFGFSLEFINLSLHSLLLLTLPTVILAAAFALWLAIKFTNSLLIYVIFAGLWIGYLFLASINGNPILAGSSVLSESLYQLMLNVDPYGITAALDNFNTANQTIDLGQIINRLSVLILGLLAIYMTVTKAEPNSDYKSNSLQIKTSQAKVNSISFYFKNPIVGLVHFQLISLIKNKITLGILLLWPVLVFNEVLSGVNYSESFSVLIAPNSVDALSRAAFDMQLFLGSLLVVLWTWQITKLAKSCNMEQLTAVTPVKNYQLVLSQVASLAVMVVILVTLTGLGSLIAELINNNQLNFKSYLSILSITALPLVLLGTMFLSLHHIFKSNLAVMVTIAFILLFKFTPLAVNLEIAHTFWNIAGSTLRTPDNYWGFDRSLSVYLPYMGLWILFSLSLVLLVSYRSHRGTQIDVSPFLKIPLPIILAFCLTGFYGLSLHWQLAEEKPLYNSHKREAWKANYEKSYGNWANKPQPTVIAIDSKVDIYPEQEYADFQLVYTLQNQTDKTINQVLIGQYSMGFIANVDDTEFSSVKFDDELSQGIYDFAQPLLPSEQRKVKINFTYKQPQLWPATMHQTVKSKFTYLRSIPLLPVIGYKQVLQLQDPDLREKFELAPLTEIKPSQLENNDDEIAAEYQWIQLSSQISTASNHNAIAQGALVKQWAEGDRRFFHYQTKQPIRAIPTWVSVPFDKISTQSADTTLNVFTPTLGEAANINLKAMKDTLEWFATNITPYKHSQLSSIAMPEFGGTGYALPSITFIGHKVGFLSKPSESAGFDQRYRRSVHETAHQWFGHDIGNGVPDERVFLIESLTKYIELVVIEKHYGIDAMRSLVEYEQERYKQRRRADFSEQLALIDAIQSYDQYSRATLVFSKLREQIGDEPIIKALQHLWKKHAYPNKPATSLDFVRYLKNNSPLDQHSLIEQLFLSAETEYLL